MKKIIIAIMLVFCATTVRAENTNISTSQYYVDTNAATRQDAAPANNANSVMTYDSVSPDGIGAKAIYDATASYADQTGALITADTANAAIQNGINSEFVCANPPKCNLWNLAGLYGRLPAGYTELEYIESTGTQYIDTGIVASSTDYEFTVKFMQPIIENASVLGNQFEDFLIWLRGGIIYVFPQSPNSFKYALGRYVTGDFYTINLKYNGTSFTLNLDGIEILSSVEWTIAPTHTILLFANHHDAQHNYSIVDTGYVAIESVKLYNNGTMVRNFIPARQDSTGTLGMYDTVTNTFFTNAGTGEFIAGPVASYIPQNQ